MRKAIRLIGVLCVAILPGCAEQPDDPPVSGVAQAEPVTAAPEAVAPVPVVATTSSPLFVDVTDDMGLDFRHRAGHDSDPYYMPKLMGGGGAVFDPDGDGDLDVLLVDGQQGTGLRLYRQRADGNFEDATEGSGLVNRAYGMGCAVGDIDNDGDVDLYLTNYGADQLFRNAGDGTFTDVTGASGIDNERWGTSVALLDFDRDGWLDVYVANYMALDEERECQDEAGRRDFCGPDFPEQADRLYRNRGDGTFADVTEESGVGSAACAGLGVVCADFDNDGWVDIYVANDRDPNLFWANRGDGTFTEDAALLGLAYSGMGLAEAGMGVTAGDADNDGDLDLFVTHLTAETNTLYRCNDGQSFDDSTGAARLGAPSVPYTGWGTAFFDADLDGDLDLAVVNGAVQRRTPVLLHKGAFWDDYAEPNLFFRNDGLGRFISDNQAGAYLEAIAVSRGAIPFDFDGDGDQDLLVTNIEGPARLYRNETRSRRWLAIDAYDAELRRESLGAKVVIRVGERSFVRHAIPPGGYLTSAPSTIHFGLPQEGDVTAIDVQWPDGREERFEEIELGRVELRRGSGNELP